MIQVFTKSLKKQFVILETDVVYMETTISRSDEVARR